MEWHFNHLPPIDRRKFSLASNGRARQTTQTSVEPEESLACDSGQSLFLGRDVEPFAGFDRLMQSLLSRTIFKDTSCCCVNNPYFVLNNNIMNISAKDALGT